MISGDFNIDLLKFGSHSETDEFMNILGTHFFQPHILQPTRITNHSATLIDNIFFNFLDHFAIRQCLGGHSTAKLKRRL